MTWAGHVARTGDKTNAYASRLLVGNLEGKKHLGIQRRQWLDNIKVDSRDSR
jgi:hypothetical protein